MYLGRKAMDCIYRHTQFQELENAIKFKLKNFRWIKSKFHVWEALTLSRNRITISKRVACVSGTTNTSWQVIFHTTLSVWWTIFQARIHAFISNTCSIWGTTSVQLTLALCIYFRKTNELYWIIVNKRLIFVQNGILNIQLIV